MITEKELEELTKESEKRIAKMEKEEEESVKQIWKHFDRINDKLFTFNNIMIAGFFALSKLQNSHVLSIIVPLLNMVFLLWIEYRMMEYHRFMSMFTKKPIKEISKWGKHQNFTNLYGLLSIISTLAVGLYFMILLVRS